MSEMHAGIGTCDCGPRLSLQFSPHPTPYMAFVQDPYGHMSWSGCGARPGWRGRPPPPPVALSPALVTAFTGRLVADALNPALRLVAAAEYTSLQLPTLPFESVFTTQTSSACRL